MSIPEASSRRIASLRVPNSRTHAWVLVAFFILIVNGVNVLYGVADLQVSAGLKLLLAGASLVVFWRLLDAECSPCRVRFPLDMGFFLYATNFVLLPYYFWRTQRWRGMAKLVALAGIWLGCYAAWWVVAWLLATE